MSLWSSITNFGKSLGNSALNAMSSGVTGMLGNIAGNTIGSLFGYESDAEKARRQQLALTRETNQQNYKIWQEQKQHNIDMYNLQQQGNIELWNMNNEYNDPSAQRERLENAGFNPYLAMGGNASGVSGSPAQTGNLSPSQAPTMQVPQLGQYESSWMQGLRSMSMALSNQGQAIENEYMPQRYQLEAGLITKQTAQIEEQIKNLQKEGKLKDIDLKYYEDTLDENLRLLVEQTKTAQYQNLWGFENAMNDMRIKRAEAQLAGMSVEEQREAMKYCTPRQWVIFQSGVQDLANKVTSGELTIAQTKVHLQQFTNLLQQWHINRPLQIKSQWETDIMTQDVLGDGPVRKMTPKMKYQSFVNRQFSIALQESFANSLALSLDEDALSNKLFHRYNSPDWTHWKDNWWSTDQFASDVTGGAIKLGSAFITRGKVKLK